MRLLARVLSWISLVLGVAALAICIYGSLVLLLCRQPGADTSPVSVSAGRFIINYPFSHQPFLTGPYTTGYILPTFLTVGFYGLFGLAFASVMRGFLAKKLFTESNTRKLSHFYRLNFIFPWLILLAALLLGAGWQDAGGLVVIGLLHAVIGVFAYFMTVLFRQGFVLQEEQDYTL